MKTYWANDFRLDPHPDSERWKGEFRITYVPTGEQSNFSSKEECEETIRLAIEGGLKGSFLAGP